MINVYMADLTGLEEKYDEKLNMLHQSRAEKLNAFKMQADKVRGLGAGLLLQKGLEEYLDLVNEKTLRCDEEGRPVIEYSYGPQGKPYLKEYPDVYFSLSHSGNMVALALSDAEVGIDVQEMRGYNEKIARRFYHAKEVQMLEQTADDKKEAYFYKIWCMKEAYIKYTGKGMSEDLRSFYFEEESGRIYVKDEVLAAKGQYIKLNANAYKAAVVFNRNNAEIANLIQVFL